MPLAQRRVGTSPKLVRFIQRTINIYIIYPVLKFGQAERPKLPSPEQQCKENILVWQVNEKLELLFCHTFLFLMETDETAYFYNKIEMHSTHQICFSWLGNFSLWYKNVKYTLTGISILACVAKLKEAEQCRRVFLHLIMFSCLAA